MVKQKALALSLALVMGAGLSCDAPTRPPTTGSISVILVSPENGLPMSIRGSGSGTQTSDVTTGPSGMASVTLTSVRVTVSGQTPKVVTSSTPSGGFFDVTIDQLSPGTYTVAVEGLVNGEVAHFGQTGNVAVTAGNTSAATVSFPSFQPTIPASTVVDTADVLHFTVSYGAVTGATSYIVAVSPNQNMSGATNKTVTATSTDIQVATEGKYYVTVRAANAMVPTGGLPSAPKGVYAFQGVATVTLTPGTASIVAGATQPFVPEAKDADGVTVPNVTWLWLSDKQNIATVSQGGIASGVAPGQATIIAVGKGTPGSATLTVTPPPASKLAFLTQPANASADGNLGSVQVAVQNSLGQTMTSDNTTVVSVAIGANPGSGTLGGTVTATATAGVATFSNLTINKTGAGYTLSASSSPTFTTAASSAFNITPGAATQLAFSIQPTSAIAGSPLSPAVQAEVRDANGNLVTTSRDAITVAIANNAGGGTLTGTKEVNAINGIASFSGLWIDKIGVGYTLSASSGAMTQATSSGFSIAPGPKAKLAFVAQPANVAANVAINPAVTVRLIDQFDNPVLSGTDNVTITLAGSPWKSVFSTGGSVGGSVTVAAVGGLATFNNLRMDKPGVGFTLSATSGTLTPGVSNAFNVTLGIASLAAGSGHTCAIGSANTGTYCWGENSSGQLGVVTGFGGTDSVATLVRGGQVFSSVVAGGIHTCGLTAAGAAWCWGNNDQGQLGNNTFSSSDVPVQVTGNHVFSQIAAGYLHTCGVTTQNLGIPTENQQVYCWGYNVYGQLGNNAFGADTANKPFPVRANEPLQTTALSVQVSAGYYSTCAVAVVQVGGARSAYCWGYNGNGQLGDATTVDKHVPTLVAGGLQWNSVSVGTFYHACGIVTDNTARCWGYNGWGNLGDGTFNQSTSPVALSNVAGFLWNSLSLGYYHTCGLRSNGEVYCWGNNGSGQLGNGSTTDANTRQLVTGGFSWTAVRSGGQHTCGRVTANAVYCWGANNSGQLGNANLGNARSSPTQIAQ